MRNKVSLLLTLVYFLLLFISWLIFWNRPDPYVRPDTYFLVLSAMGAVILIQVLMFYTECRYYKVLIFLEIVLLSISFNVTQQLLYQTVTSRDPWGHWILTETIVRKGQIPSFNELPSPYVKLPNFHIFIATYILISETSYKWASYLVAGTGTLLLESFVIYLLTRSIFSNEKIAFLATLFMVISDVVLYMSGRNVVPNTLGLGLTFLLLYIFMWQERLIAHLKGKSLVVLLTLGLVFTHTVSYAFALIQLIILVLFEFAANRNKPSGRESFLWVLIIFFILGIFVWGFVSDYYFRGLATRARGFFMIKRGVQRYVQRLVIPFVYVILSRLGMLLLFGISGLGILVSLTDRDLYKNSRITYLATVSGIFIVVGVVAPFIPTFLGINERLWYYGEILGSIYAGYLIIKIWQSKKLLWIKRFVIVSIVFILSYLMLGASISNDDNPLVPQYTLRTGWYDSEISAAKFAVAKSQLPIATDVDFQKFSVVRVGMLNEEYEKFPSCNLKSFDAIIKNNNCLALIRVKLIQDRYFVLGKGYSQRAYLPLGARTKSVLSGILVSRNLVYNTESVLAVV